MRDGEETPTQGELIPFQASQGPFLLIPFITLAKSCQLFPRALKGSAPFSASPPSLHPSHHPPAPAAAATAPLTPGVFDCCPCDDALSPRHSQQSFKRQQARLLYFPRGIPPRVPWRRVLQIPALTSHPRPHDLVTDIVSFSHPRTFKSPLVSLCRSLLPDLQVTVHFTSLTSAASPSESGSEHPVPP